MRGFASDVRVAAHRFGLDQGFVLASALAFAFLCCLAPLALILFSVAGFLLESEEIAEYVLESASLFVPAYGEELTEFLKLLMRERTVTGLVGGVSMAITVSRLFALTRTVVNRAFRVTVYRGPVQGFLFDLFAVFVVGSLMVAYTVAIVILAALGDFAVRQAPVPLPDLPLKWIVSVALVYLVGGGLLFFVYRAFPNTWVPVRAAMTATVTVAVLWVLAGRAFGAYVAWFGFYGKLYGSFGIGVAALIWIYYTTTIFVFGAELAAVVAERFGRTPGAPAAAATDALAQSPS
jgi:membrane protein